MLDKTAVRFHTNFVTLFVYQIIQLYEYILFLYENNLSSNKFVFVECHPLKSSHKFLHVARGWNRLPISGITFTGTEHTVAKRTKMVRRGINQQGK